MRTQDRTQLTPHIFSSFLAGDGGPDFEPLPIANLEQGHRHGGGAGVTVRRAGHPPSPYDGLPHHPAYEGYPPHPGAAGRPLMAPPQVDQQQQHPHYIPVSHHPFPLPTPNASPSQPRPPQYPRRRSSTAEVPLVPTAAVVPASPYSPRGHSGSDGSSNGGPHNMDREFKKMSLYKTELCRSWEETGTCRYGAKCQFAHSLSELRGVERHPKYKTEMCRTFWENGACPYGKRCCFIHTDNERPSTSRPTGGEVMKSGANAGIRPDGDQQLPPLSRPRTQSISNGDVSRDNLGETSGAAPSLDHHAIADAYFSGRRRSNEPYATSSGYNDMDHLTRRLQDATLGPPTHVGSYPPASVEARYAVHRRSDADGSIYPEDSHLLLQPHHHHHPPPRPYVARHVPNSVVYNSTLSGDSEMESMGSNLYTPQDTPPRERTRRSRSVTQPAGFMPADGQQWSKSRSESFSGYLPGLQSLPQDQYLAGDYYTQMTVARHNPYMSAGTGTPGPSSSSSTSAAYHSGAASAATPHQQTHQLRSPPPSGHPSPVHETILEEDNRDDADGRGPAPPRKRTQSFGRLPAFQNIKRDRD
ncbi:hypothetical protein HDU88_007690 [Geranomyces variabilis]|nr:hypothetical protein HDU88_007690 [Geranomyces variabilis]